VVGIRVVQQVVTTAGGWVRLKTARVRGQVRPGAGRRRKKADDERVGGWSGVLDGICGRRLEQGAHFEDRPDRRELREAQAC
jgi:hypothetical protein